MTRHTILTFVHTARRASLHSIALVGLICTYLSFLSPVQAQSRTTTTGLLRTLARSQHSASLSATQLQAGAYNVYLPAVRNAGTSTEPSGKPVVAAFTADQATIAPGGETTLRWNVSSATSVRITPDVGPVSGSSATVRPAATTTYTLIAANAAGETSASVTVTVSGTAPNPGANRVALFPETQWKTSSASVAEDAAGGMHMAYYYYEPDNGQAPTSAVYRFCASDCGNVANWSSVMLGEHVNEVQLKLTTAGQPRMLFRTGMSSVYNGGKDYYYAECNQRCADQAQWQIVRVASSYGTDTFDVSDDSQPQRSFALDAQGHPRFLFLDRNYVVEPDHYGLFYMSCEAACTNVVSWSETLITRVFKQEYRFDWDVASYPALAFTPSGQPRVLSPSGFFVGDDSGGGLYYLACDSDCTSSTNWQHVRLADRGQGPLPSADIAVDSLGRSRIAFYQESRSNGGKSLLYAWCDADCVSSDANWYGTDLNLPADDGHAPDLQLDAQNRPRIAYTNTSDGGIGYTWCNTACETDGAQWQHQTIETRDMLQQLWPVPYPLTCDAGLWDALTPTLALDSTGQPRIAYDATYNARCLYQDPTNPNQPPYYRFNLVQRAVRWVAFPQP